MNTHHKNSGLRISCFRDLDSFEKVAEEWNDFMEISFPDYYNRSVKWLSAWWRSYGKNKDVYIYIITEEDSQDIVASVPLCVSREYFGGFPVRLVEILGKGIGYEDLPIISKYEDCLQLIFDDLSQRTNWQIARFVHMSRKSCASALVEYSQLQNYKYEIKQDNNFCINTTGSFENYFKSRSKQFRQNLRTAKNRMSRQGQIAYETYSAEELDEQVYKSAKAIAESSWQYKEGTSHFNLINGESFIKCLFRNLTKDVSQKFEFSFVFVGSKPIAYLFGVKNQFRYHVVDVAFDSAYAKCSPGKLLYVHLIEDKFNEPEIRMFDFGGSDDYKREYSNLSFTTETLIMFRKKFISNLVYKVRRSSSFKRLKQLIK